MSTLYEIIELADGDIALQRADEEGEPLLKIHFSNESQELLEDAKIDIAKAMIEAGLEVVGAIDLIDDADQSDIKNATIH